MARPSGIIRVARAAATTRRSRPFTSSQAASIRHSRIPAVAWSRSPPQGGAASVCGSGAGQRTRCARSAARFRVLLGLARSMPRTRHPDSQSCDSLRPPSMARLDPCGSAALPAAAVPHSICALVPVRTRFRGRHAHIDSGGCGRSGTPRKFARTSPRQFADDAIPTITSPARRPPNRVTSAQPAFVRTAYATRSLRARHPVAECWSNRLNLPAAIARAPARRGQRYSVGWVLSSVLDSDVFGFRHASPDLNQVAALVCHTEADWNKRNWFPIRRSGWKGRRIAMSPFRRRHYNAEITAASAFRRGPLKNMADPLVAVPFGHGNAEAPNRDMIARAGGCRLDGHRSSPSAPLSSS